MSRFHYKGYQEAGQGGFAGAEARPAPAGVIIDRGEARATSLRHRPNVGVSRPEPVPRMEYRTIRSQTPHEFVA